MEEKTILPDAEPAEVHTKGEVLKKPLKNRRKWILIGILAVVVSLAAGIAWFLYENEFRLEIRLSGEEELLLSYGESWEEPGADILLKGKWLLQTNHGCFKGHIFGIHGFPSFLSKTVACTAPSPKRMVMLSPHATWRTLRTSSPSLFSAMA